MAKKWVCVSVVVTLLLLRTNWVDAKLLYTDLDDVILLNVNSFNQTVLGTHNAWLVEFFSSWCGHCVRYADVYKRLAADIKGTVAKNVLTVLVYIITARKRLVFVTNSD